MKISKLMYIYS